mmetsp:Transcript_26984/g.75922  ORF Transcript_26984/g.75922 Transcript_26984/m.75922 type:complete len:412 (+) Transcript_26984:2390-3625(+)
MQCGASQLRRLCESPKKISRSSCTRRAIIFPTGSVAQLMKKKRKTEMMQNGFIKSRHKQTQEKQKRPQPISNMKFIASLIFALAMATTNAMAEPLPFESDSSSVTGIRSEVEREVVDNNKAHLRRRMGQDDAVEEDVKDDAVEPNPSDVVAPVDEEDNSPPEDEDDTEEEETPPSPPADGGNPNNSPSNTGGGRSNRCTRLAGRLQNSQSCRGPRNKKLCRAMFNNAISNCDDGSRRLLTIMNRNSAIIDFFLATPRPSSPTQAFQKVKEDGRLLAQMDTAIKAITGYGSGMFFVGTGAQVTEQCRLGSRRGATCCRRPGDCAWTEPNVLIAANSCDGGRSCANLAAGSMIFGNSCNGNLACKAFGARRGGSIKAVGVNSCNARQACKMATTSIPPRQCNRANGCIRGGMK